LKTIDRNLCTNCSTCIDICPLQVIVMDEKEFPAFSEGCVDCNCCIKACPSNAIITLEGVLSDAVECSHCRVLCKIKEGYSGACRRYRNEKGIIVRDALLHLPEPKAVDDQFAKVISKPLILGIGAGTEFPDFLPAPYIVKDKVEGIDVITAVSEVPVSYSSIRVKVDTSIDIGKPGFKVRRKGKEVGMIITEEYGSKIISIGGINLITGKSGMIAAKTIVDVANREAVELKIDNGPKIIVQVGMPPIIDGVVDKKVKAGCGGAILGLFGPRFREIADETIAVDSDIIGLFSEHLAGKVLGLKYSGVKPIGKCSTPGNYFVEEQGDGWGGTSAPTPEQVIHHIDMDTAWPGMTIFVVETNGLRAALLQLGEDGSLRRLPLSLEAEEVRAAITDLSEEARVSGVYVGGIGGSARTGVSTAPAEVNRAIRAGLMNITIGGAPTFIFPGGNIIVAVDVEKIPKGSFYLTPTPAPIIPVEYTTTLDIYKKIKGHTREIRDFENLKKEGKFSKI
jgi:6-hydroxynicotinate reductase